MFDFWAKIQSGIGNGNRFNFGHFTDCIDYRYQPQLGEIGNIQGQHCLVTFKASSNVTLPEDREGFDWREM